jgi:hypothetical protein
VGELATYTCRGADDEDPRPVPPDRGWSLGGGSPAVPPSPLPSVSVSENSPHRHRRHRRRLGGNDALNGGHCLCTINPDDEAIKDFSITAPSFILHLKDYLSLIRHQTENEKDFYVLMYSWLYEKGIS